MRNQVTALGQNSERIQALAASGASARSSKESVDLFEEFSRILDKIAVQVRVESQLPESPQVVAPRAQGDSKQASTGNGAKQMPSNPPESSEANMQQDRAVSPTGTKPESREPAVEKERTTEERSEEPTVVAADADAAEPAGATKAAPVHGSANVSAVNAQASHPVIEGDSAETLPEGTPDRQLESQSQQGRSQVRTDTVGEKGRGDTTAPRASAPAADIVGASTESAPETASAQGSEIASILRVVREQLGIRPEPTAQAQVALSSLAIRALHGGEHIADALNARLVAPGRELATAVKSALGLVDQGSRAVTGAGGSEAAMARTNGEAAVRGESPRASRQLPRALQARTLEKVEAVLKEVAQSKDGKTISLRLDPPQLGSLKVDVSYRENSLHARIVAESPAVASLLRERAFELQESLRKLGLDVDKVTVAVEARMDDGVVGQDQGAAQQSPDRQHQPRFEAGQAQPLEPSVLDVVSQIDDHWVA